MRTLAWVGAAALLLLAEGCGPKAPNPGCTDGESSPCTGAGGCAGTQVCGVDGTLGACTCPASADAGPGQRDSGIADSGTPADGGSPADSGVETDAGPSDGGPTGADSGMGTGADAGADAGSTDGGSAGMDSGAGPGPDAGTDAGTADAGSGSDGGGSSFRFPFPPVISNGGSVLTTPKVVTITFLGDPFASQLSLYGATATSSPYWDAVRAGYCIGASCIGDGPNGGDIPLTTSPAASYTDTSTGAGGTLQTFLSGLITAGKVPMPDANTVYMLYFPSTTTVTLDGQPSCSAFDGYHNQMPYGGQTVVYAVVNECPAPMMTPPITKLQNTTITASHEAIEAASDPITTQTTGGFYLDLRNPATWGWADVASVEIGDLCVDPFGLGQDETTENGFTVQRIWSIDNADAGINPCVPIPPGEVYFNAYSQYSVVLVDVGRSTSIQVHALADGPMAPWTLVAQDWTPAATPYLSFAIQGSPDGGAQAQVSSGQSVQLTVTLLADPVSSQNGEADAVLVSANGTGASATAAHFWPFIVMTPAEAADAGVMMMRRVGHPWSRADPRGHGPVRTLP